MTRRSLRFSTMLAVALSLAILAACETTPPPVVDTDNTLSVTLAGDGQGTVTSDPAGIALATGTGTADFAPGTSVTLTATAAEGSFFTGWSGACSGTAECTVTMDDDKAVTATFELGEPADATLTVTVAGDGEGTVTSDPAGIALATGTGTADFAPGEQVTLTATPAEGSFFAGWSGACTGTAECTVTMDDDKAVTATFELGEPDDATLTVTVAGDGEGTVTSDPAGIDLATGTGTADFAPGEQVTLTATAAEGSFFAGWSGACSGTAECTVTMDDDKEVTATFELGEPDVFTLTVTVGGEGQGSVTSNPEGIDAAVGETDAAEFEEGTDVTLTATAADGWDFLGWAGDTCSGLDTTCVVPMTADTTVSATFGQQTEAERTYFILTGADDAQEYLEDISEFFPPGSVDAVSSDLDLTWDTANKPGTSEDRGNVVVGLRYQNVDIPQGATITSATITFNRHAAGRGSPTLVFEGHAVDDTPEFVHGGDGTATSGISNRPRTDASFSWATPSWTTPTITTPDLAAIVQEIVDRPGWTSSNALGFTITSPNSDADNFRRADSFESAGGTTAPVLTISYSLANGNGAD